MLKEILELENPNDHIISAGIYENNITNPPYYYLIVTTRYSNMSTVPYRTYVYKTIRGAKIGFGIQYMTGAKWKKKDKEKKKDE